MLEKREFDNSQFLGRLCSAVAVVAGLFSVVVFLLLLFNYLQFRDADPVNNMLITKMRQEYASLPQKDEALAERIRDLDLLNRKAFFTNQTQLRTGATMLLVGVSAFLIAFKYSLRWRRDRPELGEVPTADKEFIAYGQSRQYLMWTGVALLAIGMAATLLTERELVQGASSGMTLASKAPAKDAGPAGAPGAEKAPASATPAVAAHPPIEAPAWEAIEKNWPSFRGPGSVGAARYTNAPTEWDVESGTNIRWKTETKLPGANSPVIWDKKLFLSAADEKTREIYCYNADSGELIWKQTVEKLKGSPEKPPKVNEDTGFAAPSMVVHGGQVFAIFANGDLVSYDADGKLMWGYNVGLPDNHYGHASSLIAFGKLLYVQLDQSKAPKLMALDVATGKQVWVAKRATISWASPILAQTPFGPQLILNSEKTVDAYNPETGAALWSQECLGGEVAPSPTYSNGVVFAANEYATASAIRLEKSDTGVTPKLLWQFDELLPEVSSPVGDGERFYFGTSAGALVCLDAKAGKKLWVKEWTDGFYSSPVLVGDRIYVADREGHMYIVQASSTFSLIATRNMGEPTLATPAFVDGRIYVRTSGHLYCIEQAHA